MNEVAQPRARRLTARRVIDWHQAAQLLAQGMTTADVASRVGCSRGALGRKRRHDTVFQSWMAGCRDAAAAADSPPLADLRHTLQKAIENEVGDGNVRVILWLADRLKLVTPPDGQTTLIAPTECRETPTVWRWIERHLAGNGPIRRVEIVDVRQSMANGGGPACLRLRVVTDPATVDRRFLVDDSRLDRIADVVRRHWPVEIANAELHSAALIRDIEAARSALLETLGLTELA